MRTLATLLVAVLLLAACGSNNNQSTNPDDTAAVDLEQMTPKALYDLTVADGNDLEGFYLCEQGTLSGEWIRDDYTGATGSISGYWIGDMNDTLGYFDGSFGGSNPMFPILTATISGYETDEVIAQVYGLYRYTDYRECAICGSGVGEFAAVFIYEDHTTAGIIVADVGGLDLDPTILSLPMSGEWQRYCRTEAATE